ncbi:phosphoesterase [Paludibaculum fermentans]|uniref:Phosphoesterase n=1 Tax=Paludibaculum fermentans TaxID=1473598 RepID=A0A7S7NYE5_PALFE|nr:phosphoesterase [Paludibaculum fermentans]QOY91514.1 phosphoesterase [Paludibaculum fermentans]
MIRAVRTAFSIPAVGLTLVSLLSTAPSAAQPRTQAVPNMGQQITPLAPQGARFEPLNADFPYDPAFPPGQAWLVSHAVTTAVSPDHKTLLIMTSGYNRVSNTHNLPEPPPVTTPPTPPTPTWMANYSMEYIFVYDISTPKPFKKQVLLVPYTYNGLVFDPSGNAFYISGGPSDYVFIANRNSDGTWSNKFTPLPLGHKGVGNGLAVPPGAPPAAINERVSVVPCASGVAISKDGQTLVVANYYNDSISVFTGGLGKWVLYRELDLRPGKTDPSKAGVPGGEYPFWVSIKGSGADAIAYVSSIRDREIVVVKLAGAPELFNPAGRPTIITRIPVKGQPNKMTLNAAQTFLYVAEDQADIVDVIDTAANTVVESIPVIASNVPAALAQYKGANPNSVTLSPDETRLYVTNGNLNCIAVIALSGNNSGDKVIGLIPTGWYPNSVSLSGDGQTVYSVNGKSPTGPNPAWCYGGYGPPGWPTCLDTNEYNPQLTKAGFQSFPLPAQGALDTLTKQVAENNRFSAVSSPEDAAIMEAVRKGTRHVIFIIKENRTYDQILGDLEIGNGDPDLTEFGEQVTPNQHNLARKFVTLDNFLDTAEVSYDGWLWTTSGQAPDVVQRQYPIAYAYRGLSLDSEGTNRSVNVSIPSLADRKAANPFTPNDPDILPGQTNTAAPDGPDNEVNTGYLWDSAFRANLTVRNYGFFIDTVRYNTQNYSIPLLTDPYWAGTRVAYPSSVSLAPYTDLFFRGFDNAFPDYYRFKEWERDFDSAYAKGGLPSLSLVRFMHDHTGNYDTAIEGVNTPETQVADNDYAVGMLIEKISKSIYADDTLIFIIEDDAQDGGDHVDSHRSTAYVAGAYVKQGALVSTQYNTLDFLRTIEEVLGLPPMNLNDALAKPMTDIFNTKPSPWNFSAAPSPMLYNTKLPLPPKPAGLVIPKPAHKASYWVRAMKGMDFESEDRVDPQDFNRILWKGLKGNKPYPASTTGRDLRQNRKELLERYRQSTK